MKGHDKVKKAEIFFPLASSQEPLLDRVCELRNIFGHGSRYIWQVTPQQGLNGEIWVSVHHLQNFVLIGGELRNTGIQPVEVNDFYPCEIHIRRERLDDCRIFINSGHQGYSGSLAYAGDMVIVSNGTYYLTEQVYVGNTVLTNVSGNRDLVIINGNYPATTSISVAQTTLCEERDILEQEKYRIERLLFDKGAEVTIHYAPAVTSEKPLHLDGNVDEYLTSQVGAWVYIDWQAGGSYGQSQGRRGADRCEGLKDLRLTTWVRYDGDNLYIAGAMVDDQHLFSAEVAGTENPGDRIAYTLDTDPLSGPLDRELSDRHVRIVIGPGITFRRAFVMRGGEVVETLPLYIQMMAPERWTFELKIPAGTLGLANLEAGRTLGFEIEVFDSDTKDRRLQTEAAWSGANFRSGDPRGHGQLLLH